MENRKTLTMKDTLISFETAKLAKEKGFNIELDVFNNVFDLGDNQPMFNVHRDTLLSSLNTWMNRPTQSLLQKWLREVHGIYVYSYVGSYPSDIHKGYSDYLIQRKGFEDIRSGMTNTYEEALEEGLKEALKLTKL